MLSVLRRGSRRVLIPRAAWMQRLSTQVASHKKVWEGETSPSVHAVVTAIFKRISNDKSYESRANEKCIDAQNWKLFLNSQRRLIAKNPTLYFQDDPDEASEFLKITEDLNVSTSQEALRNGAEFVFKAVMKRADESLKGLILVNTLLRNANNVSSPMHWYPLARMMKRKIIYHGGPTNSGKTYHAIERLKTVDPSIGGGLYCGPLRLLAVEVYERLNKEGILTSLRTGQEVKEVPGAYHTATTVEMTNTLLPYDVAVIDEIQMVGDQSRGFAWTRAFLGLQARELHLCGGLEASDLVRKLCASTGDDFELRVYERMSPIEVESESLRGDYSKVRPGDCIVAFTVQDLFLIRREIESKTKFKCAVINGKLPSETKSQQAKLFNEPGTGYDILIATDAIGMGLNLNIGRIIFHSVLKNGPSYTTEVNDYHADPILVKQISGRAGRRSSQFKVGKVTTWQEVDLAYVRAVVGWDIPQIPAAGISPAVEQVNAFYKEIRKAFGELDTKMTEKLPEAEIVKPAVPPTEISEQNKGKNKKKNKKGNKQDDKDQSDKSSALIDSIAASDSADSIPLTHLVERFIKTSAVNNQYFMCNMDHFFMISNFLQPIPLTMIDRFTFASAPSNIRSDKTMSQLYRYAAIYATNRPVLLGFSVAVKVPESLQEFTDLCDRNSILDLYIWLAYRFPSTFVDIDLALRLKESTVACVEEYLSQEWAFSSAEGDSNYTRSMARNEKLKAEMRARWKKQEAVLQMAIEKRDQMADSEQKKDNMNELFSEDKFSTNLVYQAAVESQTLMAKRYNILREKNARKILGNYKLGRKGFLEKESRRGVSDDDDDDVLEKADGKDSGDIWNENIDLEAYLPQSAHPALRQLTMENMLKLDRNFFYVKPLPIGQKQADEAAEGKHLLQSSATLSSESEGKVSDYVKVEDKKSIAVNVEMEDRSKPLGVRDQKQSGYNELMGRSRGTSSSDEFNADKRLETESPITAAAPVKTLLASSDSADSDEEQRLRAYLNTILRTRVVGPEAEQAYPFLVPQILMPSAFVAEYLANSLAASKPHNAVSADHHEPASSAAFAAKKKREHPVADPAAVDDKPIHMASRPQKHVMDAAVTSNMNQVKENAAKTPKVADGKVGAFKETVNLEGEAGALATKVQNFRKMKAVEPFYTPESGKEKPAGKTVQLRKNIYPQSAAVSISSSKDSATMAATIQTHL